MLDLVMPGYKDLEIWKLAREVIIDIHGMSLQLPKFELFETGQQIRRSSKSVKSAIVEGYGRRKYKNEFVKFLIYAQASNDETLDHLETLFDTHSLSDLVLYNKIFDKIELLGKKINLFTQSVIRNHRSEK
jgi:four helix bundle protein